MNLVWALDFDLNDPAAVQEFIDLNDLTHDRVQQAFLSQGVIRNEFTAYLQELLLTTIAGIPRMQQ